ncbi:MAG: hypothetical protein P8X74_08515 [Reinekea sp.]
MQTIDTRKTINPKSSRFFDQFKLFIRDKGLSYLKSRIQVEIML